MVNAGFLRMSNVNIQLNNEGWDKNYCFSILGGHLFLYILIIEFFERFFEVRIVYLAFKYVA